MKRILIIKLWALGDLLMATPLLTALHRKYPGAEITWVADTQYVGILESHPLIAELIPLDSGKWRRLLRQGKIIAWLREAHRLNADMCRRHFDVAINCHPEKWWMRVLCVAPVRVGLFATTRLPLTRKLYTHPVSELVPGAEHNTDRYLQAAKALGCPASNKTMTIGETADEAPFWEMFRQTHSIPQKALVVVLAPFSTSENRIWETDRLAALTDWLADERGARVILTVGPKDGVKAQDIVALTHAAPPIIAQGTTLREYIALLRAADLVICGDSSPMHIAAALGTPYVALFGPTPVAERAPLVGQGLSLAKPLPCAPCDLPFCRNSVFSGMPETYHNRRRAGRCPKAAASRAGERNQ